MVPGSEKLEGRCSFSLVSEIQRIPNCTFELYRSVFVCVYHIPIYCVYHIHPKFRICCVYQFEFESAALRLLELYRICCVYHIPTQLKEDRSVWNTFKHHTSLVILSSIQNFCYLLRIRSHLDRIVVVLIVIIKFYQPHQFPYSPKQ